jgi:hypothetical protein
LLVAQLGPLEYVGGKTQIPVVLGKRCHWGHCHFGRKGNGELSMLEPPDGGIAAGMRLRSALIGMAGPVSSVDLAPAGRRWASRWRGTSCRRAWEWG